MRKFLAILFGILAQFSSLAFSEESLNLEDLKTTHEPSVFHAVFSLIAVLGLIYLVGFLYQKLTVFNEKITSLNLNRQNY